MCEPVCETYDTKSNKKQIHKNEFIFAHIELWRAQYYRHRYVNHTIDSRIVRSLAYFFFHSSLRTLQCIIFSCFVVCKQHTYWRRSAVCATWPVWVVDSLWEKQNNNNKKRDEIVLCCACRRFGCLFGALFLVFFYSCSCLRSLFIMMAFAYAFSQDTHTHAIRTRTPIVSVESHRSY